MNIYDELDRCITASPVNAKISDVHDGIMFWARASNLLKNYNFTGIVDLKLERLRYQWWDFGVAHNHVWARHPDGSFYLDTSLFSNAPDKPDEPEDVDTTDPIADYDRAMGILL